MVTVTRDAVEFVARALITLNLKTTTLDVKNALRDLGFWATQNAVREFMLDITSANGDIVYEDNNGKYRDYKFADRIEWPPIDTRNNVKSVGDGLAVKADWVTTSSRGFKGHAFNPKGICVLCGCSEGASKAFNWQCALTGHSKNVTNVQAAPAFSNGTASLGVTVGNPSVLYSTSEFGDYRVSDPNGFYTRCFYGVSRGTAKNRWAKEVGMPFFLARAVKI